MKSVLRVVLWLVPVVLAIIGPSTLGCSYPFQYELGRTYYEFGYKAWRVCPPLANGKGSLD